VVVSRILARRKPKSSSISRYTARRAGFLQHTAARITIVDESEAFKVREKRSIGIKHDPLDRSMFLRFLACAVLLSETPAFGAEPDPASDRAATPSLVVAIECKTPCPRSVLKNDEFGSFGLRAAETRLELSGETTSEASILFSVNHHQYTSARYLTQRLREVAFLGGGSSGLEGGLGGDWAFGWRAPFSEDQGIFARLGLRGQLLGNAAFYASTLELPVGQAGFQLLQDRGLLIELAVSAAPMLVGRYNVDGASPRRLGGSFDYGGHLALRWQALHLEANYLRAEPGDDSRFGALDWLTLELCGGAKPLAACFDARYLSGVVSYASGNDLVRARTWYLGAQLGFLTEPQPSAGQRPARGRRR
jgi:hypothetical protein